MIRNFLALAILPVYLMVTGCTTLGMATGAAAVTGVSAAQEGGLPRAYNDTKIKLLINEAWFRYDVEAFQKLSTRVNQGRVLLTGVVQNPEHRVEAVRLTWQVPGVKQVMNEIRVAKSEGFKGFLSDGIITSRIRADLTFDRGVQSINYSVDTVQGVVYLMGVAQNQAELNRVIETVRTTPGVKRVVSYVKLAGEPILDETTSQPADEPVVLTQPTNSNLRSRPPEQQDPAFAEEIDVPAKNVPEDSPSIGDAYYN